jgi:hypothetical protein
MRALRAAVLCLALLVPGIAHAEAIAIPFAPPVDQRLAYQIEQHRPVEGKLSRFSAIRDLRFEKVADGYILHATLRAIDSDAPPLGAEPYAAALTPLVGVEHHFRVDARGQIVALDNMDAVWSAVQAGLAKMLTAFAPDTPRYRSVLSVQALLSGLSPDGRLALLAGELRPLFLFAGGAVEDGAGRGVRTVAGAPLGRPVPVEGVLRVTAQSDNALDLDEQLGGNGINVGITYRLSRHSGLIEKQQRNLMLGTRTVTEKRELTPVQ